MSNRILWLACGAALVGAIAGATWIFVRHTEPVVQPDSSALVVRDPTLTDELARQDDALEALAARVGALELRIETLAAALERRPAEVITAHEAARSEVQDERVDNPSSRTAASWLASIGGERFAGMTEAAARELLDLDLRGLPITDADLALLEGCPNLRTLGLRGTQVTDAAMASVARLPALENLDLRGTAVTGAGIASLGSATLKALHLTDSKVTDADLYRMPWLPRLEVLKLNRLSVGDAAVADVVAHYPAVRHLEIDGTRVTDDGLRRLVNENPSLQRIELRGAPITRATLDELIAAHPGLTLVP